MKHLLMRLEAPLLAFGGVSVDALGSTDELPSASLLTGLFANALGYRRTDVVELQGLQDRLRFAVRVDRSGVRLTDYQTADLGAADQGWTTRGVPEGRAGGPNTYSGQHQRFREYHADAALVLAVWLDGPAGTPDVDALANALEHPARPLFIGRKPCIPSGPLLIGQVEAQCATKALQSVPLCADPDRYPRLFERMALSAEGGSRTVHGLRNWTTGVHEGAEIWSEHVWSTTQ